MQKKKQEITTTTATIRITRVSTVLLISAVLVLSSIAAVQQLLPLTNNAAFAVENCREIEGGTACSGGGGFPPDFNRGGRTECTFDPSIDICTISGGFGSGSSEGTGGGGGRETCIEDHSTEEFFCPKVVGGGGSNPHR